MEVFIKNLGGMKALKLRVIFVLFAVFFTSLPLVQAEPEHIQVEEEPTTVVVEETTEPVKIEAEEVHIKLESVEKDIRIGFYKDDGSIYTGYIFKVEVTDADGKSEKYEDDDRDGFIIIKDVTPGIAKLNQFQTRELLSKRKNTNSRSRIMLSTNQFKTSLLRIMVRIPTRHPSQLLS